MGREVTAQTNNSRILVVDDDKKTVASIKLYLEHAGYQVSVAHDGRQAVAESRSKPPDLLLLDLMLPEISGVDVCRIVRAESSVPIIMLDVASYRGGQVTRSRFGCG